MSATSQTKKRGSWTSCHIDDSPLCTSVIASWCRQTILWQPPHRLIAALLNFITNAVIIVTLWAVSLSILGPALAMPADSEYQLQLTGGTVFSLIFLFVLANLFGHVTSLFRLPPLLGMLLAGVLQQNMPTTYLPSLQIHSTWASTLRSAALCVILLRAGLGLDPVALKKLSSMVVRLAFGPCLSEVLAVAVASYLLLDFPWLWAFMLGCVLAAVSPAVVVPCLLALQEQGLGVAKGIPTLVIAAASMDDVLAISLFTILLGIAFTKGDSLSMLIAQGPIEAVSGLVFGIGWGILCMLLPGQPNPSGLQRLLLLLGGGLLALFGSAQVELSGAGALAVLVMAFVAGMGWRKQVELAPTVNKNNELVAQVLAGLWTILQPMLFGLIGTEIRVAEIQAETVGLGVAVLVISLTVRICITYLSVHGGDLTLKEKLFVAMAWLPKATVQAALGPLALDTALRQLKAIQQPEMVVEDSLPHPMAAGFNVTGNYTLTDGSMMAGGLTIEDRIDLSKQILTIAVLVILITAPIGSVAIMLGGPRLLEAQPTKNKDNGDCSDDENEDAMEEVRTDNDAAKERAKRKRSQDSSV